MITDPGKGKSKAQATAARMTAWQKPKAKADQDKLRDERMNDYRRMVGPLPESKGGKK